MLSVLGQIGQKDLEFSELLMSIKSNVFLSVLGQIGQKEMGFSEILMYIKS